MPIISVGCPMKGLFQCPRRKRGVYFSMRLLQVYDYQIFVYVEGEEVNFLLFSYNTDISLRTRAYTIGDIYIEEQF